MIGRVACSRRVLSPGSGIGPGWASHISRAFRVRFGCAFSPSVGAGSHPGAVLDCRVHADARTPGLVGARLRLLRVRAGLSQGALAERAGVDLATVKAIERGRRRRPHPHTLARLAEALGLAEEERAAALELTADVLAAPAGADQRPGAAPFRAAAQIPVPLTSLIGRAAELAEARALLEPTTGAARLLTLIGPGGVGKTRLALAVAAALAEDYTDGLAFADLAPLRDPRLVPATIARTLGVREGGGRSARELLLDYLRDRRVLLVLDNFEHLLAAAPLVSDLLQRCPHVAALVTSRAPLHVQGEHRFAVSPLATPAVASDANEESVSTSAAVQLFVDRAQAVAAEFALSDDNAGAVADICRRLEGIPLAIELAAARVSLLRPEALLARLERRLPLLTGGATDLPQRQQTLRATLAWSHNLLDPVTQVVFRRLAVFTAGWTLQAAETVCADADLPAADVLDCLQELMDSSLVRWLGEGDRRSRIGMLETVREYAGEQLLLAGEFEHIRARHAQFYASVATPAGATPTTWPWVWVESPESTHQVLDRLDGDFDNLNTALDWLIAERHIAAGLQIAVTLNSFWARLGQYAEGRRRLETLLDLADRTTQPSEFRAERAVALTEAGTLASFQGDNEQARTFHRASVALWRELGHGPPLAVSLANQGLAEWVAGDALQATELLQEALERSRAANLAHTVVVCQRNLGLVARSQGDYARAAALFAESAAHPLPSGWFRGYTQARSLSCLGRTASLQHDFPRATASLRHAFEVIREARLTGQALADCLDFQAALEGMQGNVGRAVRLFGAADTHWRTSGAHRFQPDEAAYARDVAVVRAALDERTFADLWLQGAGLPTPRAIGYALRELELESH
ncbi:MAG: helix-turn-helix domain-containing protein [Chloroflexi bacterium]|nr:helix-turn-helix domain-containing protein [Chloroflexota bacterium]